MTKRNSIRKRFERFSLTPAPPGSGESVAASQRCARTHVGHLQPTRRTSPAALLEVNRSRRKDVDQDLALEGARLVPDLLQGNVVVENFLLLCEVSWNKPWAM